MDQIKMKKTALYLALVTALGLTACSSTKVSDVGSGAAVPPGTQQAISEQRAASDFKRKGVKVIYTFGGNLEAIETVGYAPVFGNSPMAIREAERAAELEAKKSLNDFINQETITSRVGITIVSRNVEKHRDQKTNDFATNRNRDRDFSTNDEEVSNSNGEVNREANTAVRNDATNIAQRVNTEITMNNKGILSGLKRVHGEIIEGGRTVKVVYRWDKKDAPVRTDARKLMLM